MTADLRRWLSELSRATSRHRAVLAAGHAAAAVATTLPTFAPTPVPGRLVLTAARDLAAGTALTAADLAPVTLPRALVPTGALATDGAALGRLLAGPVRRGEPLTDVRLLGASLLGAGGVRGLVGAPVRLADGAVAGLLHAGDHVVVLAAATSEAGGAAAAGAVGGSSTTPPSGPTAGAGTHPAAVVVAAAALVLAVPGAGGDGDGSLVLLAVPPLTAARLAAAAITSRLSVTMLAG